MKKHINLFIILLIICSCSSLEEEKENTKENLKINSLWLKENKDSFTFDKQWWKSFQDKELNQLIDTALKNNSNLILMQQQILLAQQNVNLSQKNQLPLADISLKGNVSSSTPDTKSLTARASWELDIWGKLSNLEKSAISSYQASQAEWQAAYLQMISQVCQYYFELRQYDELINLYEESITISNDVENIYKKQFELGSTNDERYNAQKAETLRLKNNLVNLKAQRKISLNNLAIIIGTVPGNLAIQPKNLTTSTKQIKLPSKINANLLERRPDLIAAELQIKQAWYTKESRRAANLPSVSFSLNLESVANDITDIGKKWFDVFIPQISFPILNPQLKVEEEKARINLKTQQESYKEKVRKAINEVEVSLINHKKFLDQQKLEQQRLKTIANSYEKSKIRFDAGSISQLEVLNYQQQLLSSKQELLSLYRSLLTNTVNIHNALGGSCY